MAQLGDQIPLYDLPVATEGLGGDADFRVGQPLAKVLRNRELARRYVLPAPHLVCGEDPSDDDLGCVSFPACP